MNHSRSQDPPIEVACRIPLASRSRRGRPRSGSAEPRGPLDLFPRSIRRRINYFFYEALDGLVGFDRRHGTVTGGEPAHLDIVDADRAKAHSHQACSPSVVRRGIALAGLEPQSCAFIDLGCGKGRALIVASEHPFKRIIGVELSPALAQLARDNVQRCNLARRAGLEVRCENAVDFAFPPDDLILFVFNSFDETVLQRVLERLAASLAAAPRKLCIIYQSDNLARSVLEKTAWLELVERSNVVPLGYWLMGTWALWRATEKGADR